MYLTLPDAAPLQTYFATADPFPHVAIDGFLPEVLVRQVLAEFPDPEHMEHQYNDGAQVKSASADPMSWGATTRALMEQLNAPATLSWLSEVSGIEQLVADAGFEGGGLHQIQRGGKLGIHADFNLHRRLGLERRLNLLVYLNEDWRNEWGGHLELWDVGMRQCVRRIAPVAGRAVLFATTSTSFHGHPDPLACPEGRTRRSLALYYYSQPTPGLRRHTTTFQVRPESEDVVIRQSILGRTRNALRIRSRVDQTLRSYRS